MTSHSDSYYLRHTKQRMLEILREELEIQRNIVFTSQQLVHDHIRMNENLIMTIVANQGGSDTDVDKIKSDIEEKCCLAYEFVPEKLKSMTSVTNVSLTYFFENDENMEEEEEEEQSVCNICLDEFHLKGTVTKLNECNHMFCYDCIKKYWIKQFINGKELICPCCRHYYFE